MWEIYEHRRVERQLGRLPKGILQRYEIWKAIVYASGPPGLRKVRGFGDEALSGGWKGYRSSRLNRQYRVIYAVRRGEIRVEVVSVTAHDYRRS